MKALLPTFLTYQTAADLVRLGKANDGGYLVSEKDVQDSDALIGLGINDDWSFERDFSAMRGIPITAYDGSISDRAFLERSLSALMKAHPAQFLYWWRTFRSYRGFFRPPHAHVEKHVGTVDSQHTVSMQSVIQSTQAGMLFIKIDIEGAEYEILDAVLRLADRTSGLVVEFHDFNRHLEQIHTFVEEYRLRLAHVHANNYASIDPDTKFPNVLELTFSRNSSFLDSCILPHPLDMPNDAAVSDYHLAFPDPLR